MVAVAVVALGYVGWRFAHSATPASQHVNVALLQKLKQQSNTTIDTSHLAQGLVPPTNHWFSGLALNKQPQAVFPLPLSFKPAANSFSFGLPVVTATSNTVTGGYDPAVTAALTADAYMVVRYDSVSVSLRYSQAGKQMGTLTVAEGSPYVSYVAMSDQTVHVSGFQKTNSNTLYVATVGGRQYGLTVSDGVTYDGASGILRVPASKSMAFFAVADGSTAQAMTAYALPGVSAVGASYKLADKTVTTTLAYETKDSNPTLFAALPDQQVTSAKALAGTYRTIYGRLSLYAGTTFSFGTPKVTASSQLSLGALSAHDKNTLISALQADVAATDLRKTDSYYGGKELYRAANLYVLANQLGQHDLAQNLKAMITADLDQWFDPTGYTLRSNRYFYYDKTVRGLVAAEPSFGSEQFNDHHFHYGYFLYAAAVMARYDSAFARQHASFVNLLVSDIAAPATGTYFPQQRVFDPYMGHSWASGYGQFNDGNNQESSSEAINAWNGLGAWALANNDTALAGQATWMLSRETASAQADWTAPATADFSGFTHRSFGINWGGKRDYATFFSADPAAIFGIQLIPLNPAMMVSLQAEKTDITTHLAAALPDGSYDKQFGDYLLMYRSLVNKAAALPIAENLPITDIDDANSRSYMVAWILSQ